MTNIIIVIIITIIIVIMSSINSSIVFPLRDRLGTWTWSTRPPRLPPKTLRLLELCNAAKNPEAPNNLRSDSDDDGSGSGDDDGAQRP